VIRIRRADGLRIKPCLPSDWAGFTATRRFRGATYRIAVRRASVPQGDGVQLLLDGQPLDGTVVPAAAAGTTVDVEAVLPGR
jgi:cellobiose phosphorylase